MSYTFDAPGQAEAAAGAAHSAGRRALLDAVRGIGGLENARLAAVREDSWLAQRKVLSADGRVIAEDHHAWLEQQLRADGGDFAATQARLPALDLRLSQCELATLYVVAERGGRQHNFVPLLVHQHDEFCDRRLFSGHRVLKRWQERPYGF
jgi:hypothetical protein